MPADTIIERAYSVIVADKLIIVAGEQQLVYRFACLTIAKLPGRHFHREHKEIHVFRVLHDGRVFLQGLQNFHESTVGRITCTNEEIRERRSVARQRGRTT